MTRFVLVISLATTLAGPLLAQDCVHLESQRSGYELREEIRLVFAPRIRLSYAQARDSLYLRVDGVDGIVEGVYTGFEAILSEGDPSVVLFAQGINAEHIWPRSMGAKNWPELADLHNIFPSHSPVNNARGNKPYAELVDDEAEYRYQEAGKPEASLADRSFFEPRPSRKGDVARAALYHYTIYEGIADPEFLHNQLPTLLAWHAIDPPDPEELIRSVGISRLQGNCNPFVVQPELAIPAFGR